jgi:hypothetical protein
MKTLFAILVTITICIFGVSAYAASNVTLSWNSSSGATNYKVYQSTTSGTYNKTTGKVCDTSLLTCTVNNIPDGTYYWVATASDAVGVSGCKWRIGSAPDANNGTACTGTTAWTCNTSGYSSGSNTLYVGCYDAAGNFGTDTVTVTYTPPTTSTASGVVISGGVFYR